MNTVEAARKMGVGEAEARRMAQAGIVAATKTGGGWRFDPESVRAYERPEEADLPEGAEMEALYWEHGSCSAVAALLGCSEDDVADRMPGRIGSGGYVRNPLAGFVPRRDNGRIQVQTMLNLAQHKLPREDRCYDNCPFGLGGGYDELDCLSMGGGCPLIENEKNASLLQRD